MNKICTSIEQSQKLVELGIDIDTADMMWDDWNLIDEGWKLSIGYYPEIKKDYGRKCYPAWSLSALLELIPSYLGDFKDGIDFIFSKAINGKRYSAEYIKFNNNGLAIFNHKTVTGDTAIDAVFGIVCWLLENKKIQ